MNYRELGETGMRVSEISPGTWAFGSEWGTVSDSDSIPAARTPLKSKTT